MRRSKALDARTSLVHDRSRTKAAARTPARMRAVASRSSTTGVAEPDPDASYVAGPDPDASYVAEAVAVHPAR
jgi:hypothetical protein